MDVVKPGRRQIEIMEWINAWDSDREERTITLGDLVDGVIEDGIIGYPSIVLLRLSGLVDAGLVNISDEPSRYAWNWLMPVRLTAAGCEYIGASA